MCAALAWIPTVSALWPHNVDSSTSEGESTVWNGRAYDCQQCGACCANHESVPDTGYVCLTRDESNAWAYRLCKREGALTWGRVGGRKLPTPFASPCRDG
jgi:hypothetical protein